MAGRGDEEFHISTGSDKSALQERIERERRLQTRARRARATCRWTVMVCGLGGLASFFLGLQFHFTWLVGLGCLLILPTLIAAVVLFFLGGLAPSATRRVLSKRQRQMLDD